MRSAENARSRRQQRVARGELTMQIVDRGKKGIIAKENHTEHLNRSSLQVDGVQREARTGKLLLSPPRNAVYEIQEDEELEATIAITRKELYDYQPQLEEDTLRQPSFRFLHATISSILDQSGLFSGIFSEQPELADIKTCGKSRQFQYEYLRLIIDALTCGCPLDLHPASICSGQKPLEANKLLQQLGKAAKLSTEASSRRAVRTALKRCKERRLEKDTMVAADVEFSKRSQCPASIQVSQPTRVESPRLSRPSSLSSSSFTSRRRSYRRQSSMMSGTRSASETAEEANETKVSVSAPEPFISLATGPSIDTVRLPDFRKGVLDPFSLRAEERMRSIESTVPTVLAASNVSHIHPDGVRGRKFTTPTPPSTSRTKASKEKVRRPEFATKDGEVKNCRDLILIENSSDVNMEDFRRNDNGIEKGFEQQHSKVVSSPSSRIPTGSTAEDHDEKTAKKLQREGLRRARSLHRGGNEIESTAGVSASNTCTASKDAHASLSSTKKANRCTGAVIRGERITFLDLMVNSSDDDDDDDGADDDQDLVTNKSESLKNMHSKIVVTRKHRSRVEETTVITEARELRAVEKGTKEPAVEHAVAAAEAAGDNLAEKNRLLRNRLANEREDAKEVLASATAEIKRLKDLANAESKALRSVDDLEIAVAVDAAVTAETREKETAQAAERSRNAEVIAAEEAKRKVEEKNMVLQKRLEETEAAVAEAAARMAADTTQRDAESAKAIEVAASRAAKKAAEKAKADVIAEVAGERERLADETAAMAAMRQELEALRAATELAEQCRVAEIEAEKAAIDGKRRELREQEEALVARHRKKELRLEESLEETAAAKAAAEAERQTMLMAHQEEVRAMSTTTESNTNDPKIISLESCSSVFKAEESTVVDEDNKLLCDHSSPVAINAVKDNNKEHLKLQLVTISEISDRCRVKAEPYNEELAVNSKDCDEDDGEEDDDEPIEIFENLQDKEIERNLPLICEESNEDLLEMAFKRDDDDDRQTSDLNKEIIDSDRNVKSDTTKKDNRGLEKNPRVRPIDGKDIGHIELEPTYISGKRSSTSDQDLLQRAFFGDSESDTSSHSLIGELDKGTPSLEVTTASENEEVTIQQHGLCSQCHRAQLRWEMSLKKRRSKLCILRSKDLRRVAGDTETPLRGCTSKEDVVDSIILKSRQPRSSNAQSEAFRRVFYYCKGGRHDPERQHSLKTPSDTPLPDDNDDDLLIPGIHLAATTGHIKCLETFLNNPIYTRGVEQSKDNELTDESQEKWLGSKEVDMAGRTALYCATLEDQDRVAEVLIEVWPGACMIGDENGDTILHAAAAFSPAILQLVLDKAVVRGAVEESKDANTDDPLSDNTQLYSAEALLQRLVDRVNRQGIRPSHLATDVAVLRKLDASGADLVAADREGRTPLFVACAMGRAACAGFLCELLSHNDDYLRAADERGDTPLHAASCNGSAECVRLLLSYGVEPGPINKAGLKPIDLATKRSHEQCVRLLREYDIHHNTGASDFDSVLFLATLNGLQQAKKVSSQAEHTGPSPSNECGVRRHLQQSAWSLRRAHSMRVQQWGDWIAYEDPEHSHEVFWYHHYSGQYQWSPPKEVLDMQRRDMAEAMMFNKTTHNRYRAMQKTNLPHTGGSSQNVLTSEGSFSTKYAGAKWRAMQMGSMRLKKIGETPWIQYSGPGGRTFYFNEASGHFQWERPAVAGEKLIASSNTDRTLKIDVCNRALGGTMTELSDWQKYQDPESGGYYYYNHQTGESTWKEPEGFRLDDEAHEVHDLDDLGI